MLSEKLRIFGDGLMRCDSQRGVSGGGGVLSSVIVSVVPMEGGVAPVVAPERSEYWGGRGAGPRFYFERGLGHRAEGARKLRVFGGCECKGARKICIIVRKICGFMTFFRKETAFLTFSLFFNVFLLFFADFFV